MTVSDLAKKLNMGSSHLYEVINGIRLSPKTEKRVSAFFGKPWEELFPPRGRDELAAMRRGA
jgi:transcriptional regulator with XRE-family HTH domain